MPSDVVKPTGTHDTSAPCVVAYVRASGEGKAAAGMKDDDEGGWSGLAVAVSLTSTVVSDVVTYDETIALVNPPSAVKEGMTADVAVIDQTAP